jgi:hypothetical protein
MSEGLRDSLKKAPSASGLTLDERIQRKLDRETGGRRRRGSKRTELSFSMPPESSASSDPDREAIRQSLIEKRKNMPVSKHLSASMKMKMNAEDLAKLDEDDFSVEEEEAMPKGWECAKCTFLNENMDHLACSICSAPRYKK